MSDLNGDAGHDLTYAAAYCGLSPHTIRALARRKAIAHYRVGRRLVFKDADLASFMADRRVEANTGGGA